ncbi:DUF3169 family protein [Bacillus tuaregi]|uniref:DUF3169 family protein n=1 Tax=Bacillus tuaregi TaxID=1816695 RepID=UPI0008F82148|nr:DUF3169 family protein [Bacillus tuaregi]
MKAWLHILLSAIAGFVVSILLIKGFKEVDFIQYADSVVVGILVIIFILLMLSVVFYRQIKRLNNQEVSGDEEDEMDGLMYKKAADYSLFVQLSMILAVLALCISVITTQSVAIAITSVTAMFICYLFSMLLTILMKQVYPERNLPGFSEKDYAKKLLEVSDEGERHVMLMGLYKSYNFFSIGLLFAIFITTFYSLATGNSQIFSIIVMCMVLLLAHGKYSLTIRNK